MNIIEKPIPKGKFNRPGTKSTPKRICIHYTGDPGATAERLALFFAANPNAQTSSQYIVGLNGEIIRCIPDNEIAYAASGKNAGTIHIEVCHADKTGVFAEKSIAALAELVPYLMDKYDITAENVVRHYDLTRKACPMYYIDSARWAELKARIIPKKKLYRVQVGAFGDKSNAEKYAEQVRNAGFGAFVVEVIE